MNNEEFYRLKLEKVYQYIKEEMDVWDYDAQALTEIIEDMEEEQPFIRRIEIFEYQDNSNELAWNRMPSIRRKK